MWHDEAQCWVNTEVVVTSNVNVPDRRVKRGSQCLGQAESQVKFGGLLTETEYFKLPLNKIVRRK